jgi:hypothetical protein
MENAGSNPSPGTIELLVPEKSLSKTICVDIISAIVSSAAVAPFITIIDQAIFSNASGKEKLQISVYNSTKKLFSTPGMFLKSPQFLWIWAVYSGTYIVANSSQSIAIHLNKDPKIPQFVASSVANIGLSSLKDGYFTKMFGNVSMHKVGVTSYLCYAIRDSSTVFASFVLPKYWSQAFSNQGLSETKSKVLGQLLSPCFMQFFSTPLHLYGIDIYNRPSKLMSERITFIKREYIKTVSARIGRIFPAFGIGGVANTYLRTKLA